MSALSPDVLMDPDTLDLPAFTQHAAGIEVTAQRVRVRFQTHRGDWPLDINVGIPWVSILSTKPLDLEALAALLVLEATDTAGVEEVGDLEFLVDEDDPQSVSISMRLRTEFGVIPVTVTPPGIKGNLSIVVGGIIGHSGTVAP